MAIILNAIVGVNQTQEQKDSIPSMKLGLGRKTTSTNTKPKLNRNGFKTTVCYCPGVAQSESRPQSNPESVSGFEMLFTQYVDFPVHIHTFICLFY